MADILCRGQILTLFALAPCVDRHQTPRGFGDFGILGELWRASQACRAHADRRIGTGQAHYPFPRGFGRCSKFSVSIGLSRTSRLLAVLAAVIFLEQHPRRQKERGNLFGAAPYAAKGEG